MSNKNCKNCNNQKKKKNKQSKRKSWSKRKRAPKYKGASDYISYTNAPVSKGFTRNANQHVQRVKRREYIMDVGAGATNRFGAVFNNVGTSNGLITSIANLAINAGLTSSFPWLGTFAKGFEKFVFKALEFDFEPTCPTSTTGTVTMALNSNPARPETSKDEVDYSSKANSVQTSAWKAASLKVPVEKIQETTKAKLIRTGPITIDDDANMTDAGIVDIVLKTSGTNADTTLGKLYASYDCELINPKLSANPIQYLMTMSSGQVSYLNDFYTPTSPTTLVGDGNATTRFSVRKTIDNYNELEVTFRIVKPSAFFYIDMYTYMLTAGLSSVSTPTPVYTKCSRASGTGYDYKYVTSAPGTTWNVCVFVQTDTTTSTLTPAYVKMGLGFAANITDVINVITAVQGCTEILPRDMLTFNKKAELGEKESGYTYRNLVVDNPTLTKKEVDNCDVFFVRNDKFSEPENIKDLEMILEGARRTGAQIFISVKNEHSPCTLENFEQRILEAKKRLLVKRV